MFVKDAPGRFSFHFREIYEKCKECIKQNFLQIREILKFWVKLVYFRQNFYCSNQGAP